MTNSIMDEHPEQDLAPTGEINLDTVKERALKGIVFLTGRTFFIQIISLIAVSFLTVFLSPSQLGIFWIVSAVVNFLAYFSDIGLAAALIQKKEKPDEKDLKTTFTVQQLLVLFLLVILYFAMPFFTKVYSLDKQGQYLLYALGISLFMSSLKTIPSTLLERELQFEKIVFPQVLENLVFNLVAVTLAWKGYGIKAYTIAVLARGLVGLVVIYILRPWKPGIAFSKKSFKKLISFGLPYQMNTLLASLKDDGMTAFLGGILGPAGMGYLGWAQKYAYIPLRFFMDPVTKVTFPAFSRMQANEGELRRTVTRSILFICILVFPCVVGLIILVPILIQLIPNYSKWIPALTALSLIGINTLFASVTTQLTNLLNAIGKIKITFKLMVMWTILTWVFVPFLAIRYGINGAALGYSLVGASSIVAIIIVKRIVNFSLVDGVLKPGVAALVMGILIKVISKYLPVSLLSLILLIGLGAICYASVAYMLIGPTILTDVKKATKTFLKKR